MRFRAGEIKKSSLSGRKKLFVVVMVVVVVVVAIFLSIYFYNLSYRGDVERWPPMFTCSLFLKDVSLAEGEVEFEIKDIRFFISDPADSDYRPPVPQKDGGPYLKEISVGVVRVGGKYVMLDLNDTDWSYVDVDSDGFISIGDHLILKNVYISPNSKVYDVILRYYDGYVTGSLYGSLYLSYIRGDLFLVGLNRTSGEAFLRVENVSLLNPTGSNLVYHPAVYTGDGGLTLSVWWVTVRTPDGDVCVYPGSPNGTPLLDYRDVNNNSIIDDGDEVIVYNMSALLSDEENSLWNVVLWFEDRENGGSGWLSMRKPIIQ